LGQKTTTNPPVTEDEKNTTRAIIAVACFKAMLRDLIIFYPFRTSPVPTEERSDGYRFYR